MSVEAMRKWLEALNSFPHRHLTPFIVEARNDLRQTIAEAEKQEPVAEVIRNGSNAEIIRFLPAGLHLQVGTKLYTHPQPKREPLTHEQRLDLHTAFEPHKSKWNAQSILIDMVEAAHGIKE
jgi:hypothetical protein